MRNRVSSVVTLGFLCFFPFCVFAYPQPSEEPQDTKEALTKPDLYAWRLFVALNWPANMLERKADPQKKFGSNDPVVWESWKLSSGTNDEVFLPAGADPGPWLPGKEFDPCEPKRFEPIPLKQIAAFPEFRASFHENRDILFDPTRVGPGRNENHMNKASYDFIRDNEFYHIGGQEKFFEEAEQKMTEAREACLDPNKPCIPVDERTYKLEFPLEAKEVKAQWREIDPAEKDRFRWEECIEEDGKKTVYGLTALHITTKDLPNWFWATFEHVDNPKMENGEPWILPSRDLAAGPNGYPEGMGIEGTRWANYRLRGTQIDFTTSTGKPTLLANAQIEQGFQASSSCITCHALATIGPKDGDFDNRLSFFNQIFPHFNPDGSEADLLVGDVGTTDHGLFENKRSSIFFGDLEKSPRLLYLQTDFVWSFMRARRRP